MISEDIGLWRHSCVWILGCKRFPPLFWYGRNTMSSGLSRQNLVYVIDSLLGLPLLVSVLFEWGDDSFRDPFLCSIQILFWYSTIVVFFDFFFQFLPDCNSSVTSFQIDSEFFSPVMYTNLHLVETSLTCSPWTPPASMVGCCVGLWQGFACVLHMSQVLSQCSCL